MKKIIPTILVILIVSSLAVSCKKDGVRVGAAGKVQIEFWTTNLAPSFTPFVRGLIAKYEAETPNTKIVWQDLTAGDMEAKFLARTESGNPPDVVNISTQLALVYAAKGVLLDLEANSTPAQKDIYLDAAYECAQLGNAVYAFPWYATPNITIYNKELLTKGGLSAPPKTFDEAFTVAAEFKRKTGAFIINPPGVFEAFYQYGIKMVSDDKKSAVFDTPEAVMLVSLLRELGQSGAISTETGAWGDREAARRLYAAEKVAMILGGTEAVARLREDAPQVIGKTGVGAAVMGSANVSSEAIMSLVVAKVSKRPLEAIAFANYITNDENQLALCREVSIYPTTKIAAADPFFKEKLETLEGEAAYYASISAQDAADMTLGLANDYEVKREIDKIADAVFTGGASAEKAVSDAAARVTKLLK